MEIRYRGVQWMGSFGEVTRPMFCDMVGLGVTEAFAELEKSSEEPVAQERSPIYDLWDYSTWFDGESLIENTFLRYACGRSTSSPARRPRRRRELLQISKRISTFPPASHDDRLPPLLSRSPSYLRPPPSIARLL